MKPSLNRGTHVSHRLYGSGIILDEWGSWYSCRGCYVELKPAQLHFTNFPYKREFITGQCDECAAKALYSQDQDDSLLHPLQVSGKGTYDVLFSDGKTRAINLCWLTVKHGLVAEPRVAA